MSTIVGTNIEVTNLKYDSDTTSMIISNTGQVTIQGEGSNTTNLQQGLAKAFISFDGVGTSAEEDTFNSSLVTDHGTGQYTLGVTNNMASVNYIVTCETGLEVVVPMFIAENDIIKIDTKDKSYMTRVT